MSITYSIETSEQIQVNLTSERRNFKEAIILGHEFAFAKIILMKIRKLENQLTGLFSPEKRNDHI